MGTVRQSRAPGMSPRPSVCRVGQDFYLVTSTFEYFPGLPLHHSRDLVHWRPLGHVLDRPSQLPLDGVRASASVPAERIYLAVEAHGQAYVARFASVPGQWRQLGEPFDGRVLSTPVAGGFTGAYLGMYASGNGQPSDTVADFDWFDYLGL